MSAIGPGDFVECVDSLHGINLGKVFLCTEIIRIPTWCGDHDKECGGIHLKELPNPRNGGGWAACCFRPLKRRDEQLLRDLMQPLPADVEPVHA